MSFHRLLIGLSVIAALAGCDMLDMKNPFGDQREPQMVNGPRRPPVLNPGVFAPPPATTPQTALTPFDQYDTSGNPIVPASSPDTALENQSPGFFDRLFGRVPESGQELPAGRKAILSNPNYPHHSEASQAMPPMPGTPLPTKPLEERNVGAAPAAAAESESPPSSPGPFAWLGQLFDSGGSEGIDPDAPYPSLSSVPPAPTEFQAVKASEIPKKQDLEWERNAAQQSKRQLDSEPSQQQPMAPVEMPASNPPPSPQSNAFPPPNVHYLGNVPPELAPSAGGAQQLPEMKSAPLPEPILADPSVSALPPPVLLQQVKSLRSGQ